MGHEVMGTDDLAVQFIEYVKKLQKGEVSGNSWNDFFDYVDVSVEHRTDFGVAAILKQAREILDKQEQDFEEKLVGRW